MDEVIHSRGTKSSPKKLNTKGCCFICLQVIDFKTELGTESLKPRNEAVSLNCIHRYLRINTVKLSGSGTTTANLQDDKAASTKSEEIHADLCESCRGVVKRFTKCFVALEKAQMEVSYWLDMIHQQISEAAHKPELVQNYSKRTTSDPETLTQLVFVDKLRKEIAAKSLKSESIKGPYLQLRRVKFKKVVVKRRPPMSPPIPQPALEDFSMDGIEDQMSDEFESESLSNLKENVKKEEPLRASKANLRLHHNNMKKTSNSALGSTRTKLQVGIQYSFNHETRKFNCSICKKEFKWGSGARRHYVTLHLNKKFKCDNCNKVYTQSHNLNMHKETCKKLLLLRLAKNQARLTDPRFKFACSVCGKKFRSKSEQNRHRIVHLNQRNHECDICKKRYKSSGMLSNHKKVVHLKVKIYCKTCNKGFPYTCHSQLRAHERKCVVNVVSKTERETDEASI